MYKFASAILLLLFANSAFAQNKVRFEFTLADSTLKHSLYNTLSFIDTRADTSNFGTVQTGAFNRNGMVVSEKPFSAEVKRIFASLVDANAGNGELLLQIRHFNFLEMTGALGENGYCVIKAEMYVQKGAAYQKLNSIDTLLHLRSSIDVTNKLLRTGSQQLTAFIGTGLTATPAGDALVYTINDIMHIDSIEKRAIKVYNTNTYADGLYLTYQSFKNQIPDKQVIVENDYLFEGNVKAPDEKGKLKDVKLKKTYAVVHKGVPYICTAYGFYPLTRVNDEFTFTGKAKVQANTAGVIVAGAMFGALGTIMAGAGDDVTYEMRIDHQNGTIIKLKEIPSPKATGISGSNDGWD